MTLGTGDHQYERVEGWVKLPEYFVMGDVVDVATDSHDRLFVFCRGNHPVMIFDSDGNFLFWFGGFGVSSGAMRYPRYITGDGDRQVFVLERVGERYQKFVMDRD